MVNTYCWAWTINQRRTWNWNFHLWIYGSMNFHLWIYKMFFPFLPFFFSHFLFGEVQPSAFAGSDWPVASAFFFAAIASTSALWGRIFWGNISLIHLPWAHPPWGECGSLYPPPRRSPSPPSPSQSPSQSWMDFMRPAIYHLAGVHSTTRSYQPILKLILGEI